jgi:hypothetical protein
MNEPINYKSQSTQLNIQKIARIETLNRELFEAKAHLRAMLDCYFNDNCEGMLDIATRADRWDIEHND